ncbi:MAG: thiamine pyrophosphate-dependent dehydrogenase E1 component subunit alpha [Planctomycetes bacterium]|nr:thiamine pyrophosphate-dependent dehydrogenase E1 component subunit alpha [Planctomycetota bacterium]
MTEVRRILGEDGSLLGDAVDLHRNQLLEFWRFMLLGRELDRMLEELRGSGRIGPYVGSAGTEACAVGVAAALKPRDWLFPSWRMTAAALVRDVELDALVNNALGNERDRARGRQGPGGLGFRDELVAPISAPVGTQIAQAVGAAHAARLRGDGAVAVALFGAAASESADYHSGLNFAGVLRAPVVFVALGDQDLGASATGYGLASSLVDGDDVLAVFAATREALERARNGEGATLISAIGGHEGRGLDRLGRHLVGSGALADDLAAQIEAEARHELRAALDRALTAGQPEGASLFADVTATPGPALAWQRDALMRFGAEYGGAEDPEAGNILD